MLKEVNVNNRIFENEKQILLIIRNNTIPNQIMEQFDHLVEWFKSIMEFSKHSVKHLQLRYKYFFTTNYGNLKSIRVICQLLHTTNISTN